MLRHVYASLQIEYGVAPKRLQKVMGHSTLKLTLDTYGHLWPDESADRAGAVSKTSCDAIRHTGNRSLKVS